MFHIVTCVAILGVFDLLKKQKNKLAFTVLDTSAVFTSKSNVFFSSTTQNIFHRRGNETGQNEHLIQKKFCVLLVFSCLLRADETDKYVNVEVSPPGEQRVIAKRGPPVRVRSQVDISIRPACSATLRVCRRPVRRVRVWMHHLRDSCEGHHQWIMQSQKHLKGHVVWRAEEKGQLPSVFERHPARSWVDTSSTTSAGAGMSRGGLQFFCC